MMRVTVGIKALNEERHIEKAITSSLAAVAPYAGRVVLADSGSSDKTIDIARGYPITIVQLAHPAERSCGAAAQLAFQQADGDLFYLLDGDMILEPGFLAAGIDYLTAHPDVAGVGGRLHEMHPENHEFKIRTKALQKSWKSGFVDRLDGGGLYRVLAVREVGHFADRNLHAFEEFDLAARLQAKGWKLARIDVPAVQHFAHRIGGYSLLWKRFKSGNFGAAGEVLRGSVGQRHFQFVIKRLRHIRHSAVVILWWLLLGFVPFAPFGLVDKLVLLSFLLVAPILFLILRRRSLSLGIYSFATWNVGALGLILGIVRQRRSPFDPVAATILAD